jgi:ABC-2 type transport system permease protein
MSTLLQSDTVVMWRQRKSVILSIILPLTILISWRSVVEVAGGAFVLASCITVGLIGVGLLNYPGLIARDRERGVFQRLRSTPIPSWTIMVSRLLVQLIAIWLTLIPILLYGYFVYHIALSTEAIVLTFVLSIVGGSVFLAMGQALVGLIKAADTVNSTARLFTLPFIFIGALGDLGWFGDVIKTIIDWSPFGTVRMLLQFAVAPTQWTAHLTLILFLTLAYTVLFTFIGTKWFKWSTN